MAMEKIDLQVSLPVNWLSWWGRFLHDLVISNYKAGFLNYLINKCMKNLCKYAKYFILNSWYFLASVLWSSILMSFSFYSHYETLSINKVWKFISHCTENVWTSITPTNQIMLFKELIIVCSKNYTQHINA
jgi:hypothetical protein